MSTDASRFAEFFTHPQDCPEAPHRPPAGPNEDVAQCPLCLGLSFILRPEGETFGNHLKDCSLPSRHEGLCVGGGSGHPQEPHVRGWWKGWPSID